MKISGEGAGEPNTSIHIPRGTGRLGLAGSCEKDPEEDTYIHIPGPEWVLNTSTHISGGQCSWNLRTKGDLRELNASIHIFEVPLTKTPLTTHNVPSL